MLAAGIDSHIISMDAVFFKGGVYCYFSLKCGVYSRAAFNRINTAKYVLRSKLSLYL